MTTTVNLALACRQIARVLRGEAAPEPDASGERADAVAELASVLTETGGGSVYANALPEAVPARAVLVQRAKVPGEGRRSLVPAPGLAAPLRLHVLYLADASEGDPAVVLERLHAAVYGALQGSEVGFDGRSAHAMHLYLPTAPSAMERYDDRHAFSAAFGRAVLYSLAEAAPA